MDTPNYSPPRRLHRIEADIKVLLASLAELAG